MYWKGRGRSLVRRAWCRLAERRGGVWAVGLEIWFSGECSVMHGGLGVVILLSRAGGDAMVEDGTSRSRSKCPIRI